MAELAAQSKIKALDELSLIVSTLKENGKTVVHCHGVFDLLHPGHIRHFEAAKQEGDVLIVTITQDKYVTKGPGHPVFKERLRAEFIAALEAVDYVAINEWSVSIETIKKLRPDVYCKGSDYIDPKEDMTGKIIDEREAIESIGGRIHFTDEITFSSTALINNHFGIFTEEARNFLTEFCTHYSSEQVINRIEALRKMKVLVIGDTIIDEYYYCTPLGKSPKENLIPARFLYGESYAGGILAIANHIAGFCDRVDLVTCLGRENNYEDFILEHLKPNVGTKFFHQPDTPTTVKRRFVDNDYFRKLFEVQFMNGGVLPGLVSEEACEYLESQISNYDLVLVGDFGHGLIDRKVISMLCDHSKFLAVNAQTNSANIGFNLITKYPRADYFSIDEPEIRLATHDRTGDIQDLVSGIVQQLGAERAAVTRGHQGSLVHNNDGNFTVVPAFSREVVDTVGAGDAFLAITSLCAAAGFPIDMLGFIGNAVGALAIRIIGNKSSIEPVPLFKYIVSLMK